MVAEAVEDDDVEGVVGVAVAVSVESVSVDAAAAGRDRGDAAQVGEGGFGGDAVGVVAGAGQELAGDLGADAGKGEQVRARRRRPAGRCGGRLPLTSSLSCWWRWASRGRAVLVACSGSLSWWPGRKSGAAGDDLRRWAGDAAVRAARVGR